MAEDKYDDQKPEGCGSSDSHCSGAGFEVHDITDELEAMVQSDMQSCHPDELVKLTFPEPVMMEIVADHHKSRDGLFNITYDYFAEEWRVFHPGYCRECEGVGKTFFEAATEYQSKIRRENEKILLSDVERKINEALPAEWSAEVSEGSVFLSEAKDGEDQLRCCFSCDTTIPAEDLIAVAKQKIVECSNVF